MFQQLYIYLSILFILTTHKNNLYNMNFNRVLNEE